MTPTPDPDLAKLGLADEVRPTRATVSPESPTKVFFHDIAGALALLAAAHDIALKQNVGARFAILRQHADGWLLDKIVRFYHVQATVPWGKSVRTSFDLWVSLSDQAFPAPGSACIFRELADSSMYDSKDLIPCWAISMQKWMDSQGGVFLRLREPV